MIGWKVQTSLFGIAISMGKLKSLAKYSFWKNLIIQPKKLNFYRNLGLYLKALEI